MSYLADEHHNRHGFVKQHAIEGSQSNETGGNWQQPG